MTTALADDLQDSVAARAARHRAAAVWFNLRDSRRVPAARVAWDRAREIWSAVESDLSPDEQRAVERRFAASHRCSSLETCPWGREAARGR